MEIRPADLPSTSAGRSSVHKHHYNTSYHQVHTSADSDDKNWDSYEFLLQEVSQLLELLTNVCSSYILTLACSQILQRKTQMALFDFSRFLHKIHFVKTDHFLC